MPPAKKYTESEVQEMIAKGLLPSWRHGFAQGLETAAAVAQERASDENTPPEGQGTALGIAQALLESRDQVIAETEEADAGGAQPTD
jgi:hypothetical protein